MTEAELVNRARGGDADAWETLTRQYQEAVFRLAYLILNDPADADDAAQETFIRAYRALDRFDVKRSLRPWLLSIAANLARNRLRSLSRYLAALQRFVRADPEALAPATLPAPDDNADLMRAIQRLSDLDREIIYLRYFSNLSESEAAEALRVAVGTVKSRTHRALERLKLVIERDYASLRENLTE